MPFRYSLSEPSAGSSKDPLPLLDEVNFHFGVLLSASLSLSLLPTPPTFGCPDVFRVQRLLVSRRVENARHGGDGEYAFTRVVNGLEGREARGSRLLH